MKKCPECQTEMEAGAKFCPKCGKVMANETNVSNNNNTKKGGLPGWAKALIIIGIIFVCIVGCVNGCTNAVNDAVDESFGGYDDQNGKTSFKVGEVFENKHLKISFDSSNLNFTNYSEYATVKEGYKVVEFRFTAENIGSENELFSYASFDCYADNEKMQQFYSVEDSGLESGGEISSGKTSKVPVYCEVPASASKITVEYKPVFADNNYEFIAE